MGWPEHDNTAAAGAGFGCDPGYQDDCTRLSHGLSPQKDITLTGFFVYNTLSVGFFLFNDIYHVLGSRFWFPIYPFCLLFSTCLAYLRREKKQEESTTWLIQLLTCFPNISTLVANCCCCRLATYLHILRYEDIYVSRYLRYRISVQGCSYRRNMFINTGQDIHTFA